MFFSYLCTDILLCKDSVKKRNGRQNKEMNRLNLPSFDLKLSGTKEKPKIFDILRKRYVALTPEEWVRQHFIHYLINYKGYPKALMANEVQLQIGSKLLRADSVLYDLQLKPKIIIEYKAPSIPITQKVFDQAFAYNTQLHVNYLMVSNGINHYCCKIDYAHHNYILLADIPDYHQL